MPYLQFVLSQSDKLGGKTQIFGILLSQNAKSAIVFHPTQTEANLYNLYQCPILMLIQRNVYPCSCGWRMILFDIFLEVKWHLVGSSKCSNFYLHYSTFMPMRWNVHNSRISVSCLILSLYSGILEQQFWKRIFVQIMEGFDAHFWQEKKCEGGFFWRI